MINCSLGDDGVHSYEDTCSFTCNTGYELTGSDTRTCQSDGSWNGSDDVCRRGNVNVTVTCLQLWLAFTVATLYCKLFEVESFAITKLNGKHSWLNGCLVWPKSIAQAISLEMFCDYQSIYAICNKQ